MLAGPATELIGNLLARPPAGGGITGPGTEECLREKKNVLSSRFGEPACVCVSVWQRESTGPGEDKREDRGGEYIVAFRYYVSQLGMSQQWDWHLNLVQSEIAEGGDFASEVDCEHRAR